MDLPEGLLALLRQPSTCYLATDAYAAIREASRLGPVSTGWVHARELREVAPPDRSRPVASAQQPRDGLGVERLDQRRQPPLRDRRDGDGEFAIDQPLQVQETQQRKVEPLPDKVTPLKAPQIDGVVRIENAGTLRPGDWAEVRIVAADDYDLTGRLA